MGSQGEANRKTGRAGEEIARRYLDSRNIKYFFVEHGKIDKLICTEFLKNKGIDSSNIDDVIVYIQKNYGDIISPFEGDIFSLEVKTEETYTGNIFCEDVANDVKKMDGWFRYLKADVVYYIFLDRPNQINVIDWKKFKEIFTEDYIKDKILKNNIRYLPQKKNKEQPFNTYGYLIRISLLLKEKVLEIRDI